MKLKIRGLVFTGFAAAVFASSAMAALPAANLTEAQVDALKSTVTSKYYVDSNYQDLGEKEATDSNGDTTIDDQSDDSHYPTSKNVYEFVTSEIAELNGVANIHGDDTYVSVVDGQDNNKQVQLAQAPATQNSGITGTLTNTTTENGETTLGSADALVTAGAVKSLMDTQITSDDANNDAQMPTSKAVYDLVNDANNGFQRKITSEEANALATFGTGNDAGVGVEVGHRANTTGAESEWYVFGAKANSVYQGDNASQNHLSYLEVQRESGTGRDKFLVGIKSAALAESGTVIGNVGTVSGATAYQTTDKLTTAKAVYQYAVPNQWDASTQANKTLVTNAQGVVTVSDVPAIPEIAVNNPCRTEGVHCALVTSADSNGVTLEWTVMAGAEAD